MRNHMESEICYKGPPGSYSVLIEGFFNRVVQGFRVRGSGCRVEALGFRTGVPAKLEDPVVEKKV